MKTKVTGPKFYPAPRPGGIALDEPTTIDRRHIPTYPGAATPAERTRRTLYAIAQAAAAVLITAVLLAIAILMN